MTPYYSDDAVTIWHADCREILPAVSAEALVTDPPFNVGKDYGTSDDALAVHEYAALMRLVAESGPQRQAWVMPTKRIALFTSLMPDALPVVVPRGAQGPKRWGWYDQFDLLLVRGTPNRYVSNLWQGIRLKGEGYFFREESYGHPGYTPYPIGARLVALLSEDGEVIVDPFAGTGSTLHAAKAQGRRAIGVEISERYCEIAAKRCAQEVLDLGSAA